MKSSRFCKEESDAKFEEKHHKTNKYREIIATLPREDRWGDSLDFYEYQGFWYPFIFLESIMSLQQHFQPQPTDVFLCSFPKSGTTWLKALSYAISTRKRYDIESTNPLLTTIPHECVPFMEMDVVDDSFNRDPQLPLLSTHLPYTCLPKSIIAQGCKIVYICRDPKDAFVSLWHFISSALTKDEEVIDSSLSLSFDKEFDMFCQGKSYYGPFWEHILGFWKASLEMPEKILFFKYEDLKRDTLFYIRKLAQFLGEPFSEEEEMQGVAQKIMKICSFDNLSSLEVNKSGKHRPDTPVAINNSTYFRKGKVGDWKIHLNEQMKQQIDHLVEEKLGGFGLTFDTSDNLQSSSIEHHAIM